MYLNYSFKDEQVVQILALHCLLTLQLTMGCGRFNLKKLTYEERKARLIERLNALNASAGAEDDDEDDDE